MVAESIAHTVTPSVVSSSLFGSCRFAQAVLSPGGDTTQVVVAKESGLAPDNQREEARLHRPALGCGIIQHAVQARYIFVDNFMLEIMLGFFSLKLDGILLPRMMIDARCRIG